VCYKVISSVLEVRENKFEAARTTPVTVNSMLTFVISKAKL